MKYTIIIEKTENNYTTFCPDVPGRVAMGKTEEETEERMKEALKFHMEGLREINMKIPQGKAVVSEIEVGI